MLRTSKGKSINKIQEIINTFNIHQVIKDLQLFNIIENDSNIWFCRSLFEFLQTFIEVFLATLWEQIPVLQQHQQKNNFIKEATNKMQQMSLQKIEGLANNHQQEKVEENSLYFQKMIEQQIFQLTKYEIFNDFFLILFIEKIPNCKMMVYQENFNDFQADEVEIKIFQNIRDSGIFKSFDFLSQNSKTLIQLLKDKFLNSQSIYNKLVYMIQVSAILDNFEKEAGNAMTLLSQIRCFITNENFSHIRISNCSMKGMSFNECNFQNSIFNHVEIRSTRFLKCCLSDVKWKSIISNETLAIRFPINSIEKLFISSDNKFLGCIHKQNGLLITETNCRKKLFHIKGFHIQTDGFFPNNALLPYVKILSSDKHSAQLIYIPCNKKLKSFHPNTQENSILQIKIQKNYLILIRQSEIWQYDTGKGTSIKLFSKFATSLYFFSKTSSYMAESFKGVIILYDISKQNKTSFCDFLVPEKRFIKQMIFSQNGEFIIGDDYQSCYLFNFKTKVVLQLPLFQYQQKISQSIFNYKLGISSQGYLVRLTNQKKEVINLKTRKGIPSLQYQSYDYEFSSQITQNGTIAFGNRKQVVKFMNLNHLESNDYNVLESQYLCFSPNGRILAQVDKSGSINLWGVKNGMLQGSLNGRHGQTVCCTFCENGNFLASAGKSKIIHFWDIKKETEICQVKTHNQEVNFLSISPDRNVLIQVTNQKSLKAILIKSKKVLFSIKNDKIQVESIFYSSSQILLPLFLVNQKAKSYVIHIIDLKSRKSIFQKQYFYGLGEVNKINVKSYGFLSDGKYFITYDFSLSKITIWDLLKSSAIQEINAQNATVVPHPDGQHIIIFAKNAFTQVCYFNVWSIIIKKSIQQVNFPFCELSAVQISPNGQFLAIASDYQLYFWHLETSFWIQECIEQKGSIKNITFSQQHQILISCSEDKTIAFLDYSNDKKLETGLQQKEFIQFIALSPCHQILAKVCLDHLISLWSINDKKQIGKLNGQQRTILCLSFSQTERNLAAGYNNGVVCIWNYDELKLVKSVRIKGQNFSINSINFTSISNSFLTGDSEGLIRLWDINQELNQKVINKHLSSIKQIALSFDSSLLAFIGKEKVIYIQSLDKRQIRLELNGHKEEINSITFTFDGQILASGSLDETIRIWNVMDGVQIQCLQGFGGSVNCLVFFQDNYQIAYGSEDGKVRVYSNYSDNCQTVQFKFMSTVPREFPLDADGSTLNKAEITSCNDKDLKHIFLVSGGQE